MFLSTDVDAWLYSVLSVDPLMQQYAPGGFWAQDPPEDASFPCVRWWEQAPGKNVYRQDGYVGLSEAQPGYIVTMLDRQPAGQVDKIYGSTGNAGNPVLLNGAKRIATLFHAIYTPYNGFTWFASVLSEYQMISQEPQNQTDVMLGYWFQLRVQPS